jgi:2-polyprenyl-3-methyl-5-hydroxy-6-metoxy-1,4-benzoquinol methylase
MEGVKNMMRRIEHSEEAISGAEESQRYGEGHGKHARLQYRALLMEITALNRGGRYLEVGAGPAILTTMVAEHSPAITITAPDLSADMVDLAKSHVLEKNLQERISCAIGDAGDAASIDQLGKFDVIYSAFSLHHWKEPEKAITNLWNVLSADGILFIYDLKRVWWLYCLPANGGFIESIRASYTPKEIHGFFQKLDIKKYKITTPFPFFMQLLTAWKAGNP